MANFTVPFFSGTERNGTEQNGKDAFTLAPRTVVERLERFRLCSVNTVLVALVSVLFREPFNHPYNSFFHLSESTVVLSM